MIANRTSLNIVFLSSLNDIAKDTTPQRVVSRQ
jgi:hypothetical protein